MNSTADLRLDWCSYEAAKYAVEHWHYSRAMPGADSVRVGVWEAGSFVGCVLFGRGATPMLCRPYDLAPAEVCELVRVALRAHRAPVSRIVAIALRFLRRHCPGLRLVVSFADTAQGHHGGIYQAGGWLYAGAAATHVYRVHGRLVHPKTLHSTYGRGGQSIPWLRAHVDPRAERVVGGVKHRYLMPLDPATRARLAPLARPYPKPPRVESSGSAAPGRQPGEGGATPTSTLHRVA